MTQELLVGHGRRARALAVAFITEQPREEPPQPKMAVKTVSLLAMACLLAVGCDSSTSKPQGRDRAVAASTQALSSTDGSFVDASSMPDGQAPAVVDQAAGVSDAGMQDAQPFDASITDADLGWDAPPADGAAGVTAETAPAEGFSTRSMSMSSMMTASTSVPVVTNASNFNGMAIAAGRYIWFSSVIKVNGVGTSPVHLYVPPSHILFSASGTSYDLLVPTAEVTVDPAASTATTAFDAGCQAWHTVLPKTFSGDGFLMGLAYPVDVALPGGINPVTWNASFETDTDGISLNWQWAAAVYTTSTQDYEALQVKPVDDTQKSAYHNSDHAGTPEAYKSYVVSGARGGGGSNYTGSLSGTVTVTPTVASCIPVCSSDTTCDGVDDDCNDQVDDGYVPTPTSCGVGACARTGSMSCIDGAVTDSCHAGTASPSDATCDGVDDNCNGQTDEGYVSVSTACGVGACARTGTSSCVSGVVQQNCTAGTPGATDTTCNATDDNCNGIADEGYVSLATTCGVGACSAVGATCV